MDLKKFRAAHDAHIIAKMRQEYPQMIYHAPITRQYGIYVDIRAWLSYQDGEYYPYGGFVFGTDPEVVEATACLYPR